MSKQTYFRLLQHDRGSLEPVWTGKAYDAQHAIERAFYDETPGSLERYDIQVWSTAKIYSGIAGTGHWKTLETNVCLAP